MLDNVRSPTPPSLSRIDPDEPVRLGRRRNAGPQPATGTHLTLASVRWRKLQAGHLGRLVALHPRGGHARLSASLVPPFTDLGKIEKMPSWRTLGDLTSFKRLGRSVSRIASTHEPMGCRTIWVSRKRRRSPRIDGFRESGTRASLEMTGRSEHRRAYLNTGIGRQHAYRQQARRRGVLGDRRHVRGGLRGARTPRSGSRRSPSGGSLGADGRPAYRRLRPDPVRRRADHQDDLGARSSRSPDPTAGADRTARTSAANQQGWYHVPGDRGRRSPTRSRPSSSRSARAAGSPGTSTTGRPRPTRSTSPGPAATAASTPMQPVSATTSAGRHAGRLHRPRPGHRPGRPQRPARDPAAAGDDADLVPQPL